MYKPSEGLAEPPVAPWDESAAGEEHEALIQFMYMAPIGLVQLSEDGTVRMANPMTVQLLLPVAPGGDLSNFFTTLEGPAPELRALAAFTGPEEGPVIQDHRVAVPALRNPSGYPLVLAISLLRLGRDHLMALVSDVSEAVLRETQLRAAEAWHKQSLTLALEAAETADRAKSEFLANISHELRTPMHAISSFARLGQERFDAAPREKLGRYFDNIDGSATRLMRLLNDLLDLAKIEAGKLTYVFKLQDASALLQSLVGEFQAMAN